MGYLIDTSIFIAWERGQLQFEKLLEESGDQYVALSVISASELLHGVHRADSAQRREKRRTIVEAILENVPVLPVNLEVARNHARIWSDLREQGQMVGAHDLLIAATALTQQLTVATRNPKDFRRVDGISVSVW